MRFTADVSTAIDEEFYDSIKELGMGHEDASAGAPVWLQELLQQQASREEAFQTELRDLRAQLAAATSTTQPSNRASLHPEVSLPTFLPIFDQKIGRKVGRSWKPRDSFGMTESRSSMLQNALKLELLRETVSQADTDNHVECCTSLRMIESRLLQVKAIQSCGQRVIPTTPRTTTTAVSADAVDWQPSAAYLAFHGTVTTAAKPFRVSGISGADAAERRAQAHLSLSSAMFALSQPQKEKKELKKDCRTFEEKRLMTDEALMRTYRNEPLLQTSQHLQAGRQQSDSSRPPRARRPKWHTAIPPPGLAASDGPRLTFGNPMAGGEKT
ncbi:hypothetical protein PAAG_03405 [Paracoccidioides lutzii Pb01]|uniref:Uncharacterized protein n=1 Tax=Paracoccidioides lutzii (strain ATCC MYA-826 / Pb01) TaxID=502779 RepID=C1GX31_PARBA|nr:hypothetical protein PAAG_03405 [Paracoccidioides lutzii Pb01]EEH41119.2 hypothetical protein PAAG_03405 [Paracoccidioides lutzii Pb01]